MTPVIHIPAQVVEVGAQMRQRCAWCGAVLLDYDLRHTMSVDGSKPPGWEPGALVAVDGGLSYVVDHSDGDPLPEGACGLLDHEITGAAR